MKLGMPVHDEELVGPAAAVIRVANEEAVLYVANRSDCGWGARILTTE